jgi:hypothetical protein
VEDPPQRFHHPIPFSNRSTPSSVSTARNRSDLGAFGV